MSYFAHVDNLPTLQVPDILSGGSLYDETTVRKSFLVHPFGNGLPGWAPVAAILPALLATILLFMDQQITALIVNRKDNKLLVSIQERERVIVCLVFNAVAIEG